MNISDELLDRYFKGQSSEIERKIINDYLKTSYELLEHLLSKSEWDAVGGACISEEKSKELFNAIKKQTMQKNRFTLLKRLPAAAYILLICAFGFLILKHRINPSLDVNNKRTEKSNKTSGTTWKSLMNYTNSKQTVILPDHSKAEIYPSSELRYALPFTKTNREVYLKGKGVFNVFKDKSHPFIVYAKGISTMALGTSFTITADTKNNLFKVKLHTGKILVKNTDTTQNTFAFSQILLPGNSLVCDISRKQVKILNTNLQKTKEHAAKELTFTQTPLFKVLAQLQVVYQTNITYSPDDLKDLTFTGTIFMKNNLKQVLEDITELHKLKLIQISEGYLIEK